jgi:hypothetical protein
MRRKFLRTLVVVVAACAAMFLSVSPDDLREFDAAYVQRETLKESAESLATHRDQQAVYFSRFAAESESGYSPSSAPITPSPTLSAFSTCILRC